MSRTSLHDWPCSLARAADIIGDKWTLVILRNAFYGQTSFSGFQKSLGLARNVLSDRLDKLVEHGILVRQPVRPGVARYRYTLTDAGRELFPVIVSLTQWGDKWLFGSDGEPVRLLDKEQQAPIQKMGVIARDGRYLQADDVSFAPGPSASDELIALWERQSRPA